MDLPIRLVASQEARRPPCPRTPAGQPRCGLRRGRAGRRRLGLLAESTPTTRCSSPTWTPKPANDVVDQAQDRRRSPYQLDNGGRAIRVPADARRRAAAASSRRRRHAGVGPHRLRDLRPDRVRRHRVPRAGQLPPRARRRDRAHDRARSARSPSARVHIAMAKDVALRARSSRPRPRSSSSCAATGRWRPAPCRASPTSWRRSVEGAAPRGGGDPRQLRPSAGAARRRRRRAGAARRRWSASSRSSATWRRSVVALLEPVVGAERVARQRLGCASTPQTRRADRGDTGTRTARSSAAARRRRDAGGGASSAQGLAGSRAQSPARCRSPPQPPRRRRTGARRRRHRCPRPARPLRRAPAVPALRAAGDDELRSQQGDAPHHRPRGEIARLSVAVILDDEPARPRRRGRHDARATRRPASRGLQKIQRSSPRRSASTPERGDQLTVENMPFEEMPVDESPPTPTLWQRVGATGRTKVAASSASWRSARWRFFLFVRPLMRRATVTRGPVATARRSAPRPGAHASATSKGRSPRSSSRGRREVGRAVKLPVLTRGSPQLTAKEPEHARADPQVDVAGEPLT